MKKIFLKVLSAVSAITILSANLITGQAVGNLQDTNGNSDNYQYYFGVPHSHTSFSDAGGSSVPKQAYEYGKKKGLDFLFVTDHSNLLD